MAMLPPVSPLAGPLADRWADRLLPEDGWSQDAREQDVPLWDDRSAGDLEPDDSQPDDSQPDDSQPDDSQPDDSQQDDSQRYGLQPGVVQGRVRLAVPFELVAQLAHYYGAVDCYWRDSDRSFSRFVAEVWFWHLPSEFARGWAGVVGYPIRVRRLPNGPARFMVSIPCGIERVDWAAVKVQVAEMLAASPLGPLEPLELLESERAATQAAVPALSQASMQASMQAPIRQSGLGLEHSGDQSVA